MSSFGKKYLHKWQYCFGDIKIQKQMATRFNVTPKVLQLQILQKWYPVGMKCAIISFYDSKSYPKTVILPELLTYRYEIVGYEEFIYGWCLKLEFTSLQKVYSDSKNPLRSIPDPSFEKKLRREYNLDELV